MGSTGNRVLLIDDDRSLVELLAMKLTRSGYKAVRITQPEEGLRLATRSEFDVIVLDVIMPHMSGIEVCTLLRARGVLTPIIILSGQIDKHTIVRGLRAGADDYLTKPFHDTELLARIASLLRRHQQRFQPERLERDGVELDLITRRLRLLDQAISLTGKETLLLQRLMATAPKSITRNQLLQDVWGISGAHSSNRLDVYIRRLRHKLECIGAGSYVNTVRGAGYFFGKIN